VLGYAVILPPPWHVSECLSMVTREGQYLGQDVFTWRTPSEEHALGAGGDTGGTGALTWVISIAVETSSQTPMDYAKARGGSVGDKVGPTTIDGQQAVRVTGGIGGTSIYVANAGRMYGLSARPSSQQPSPQTTDVSLTFEAIARSLTFMTPTARPTPTRAPTFSPAVETVVDAVAAAFAASDADRLRSLLPPKCWFQSAGYRTSGVSISAEQMADSLRSAFTAGLKVVVESRPINSDAPFVRGPFWVWSTWSAYGSAPFTPASTVQLVFDQADGSWFWTGALFNAAELRRP